MPGWPCSRSNLLRPPGLRWAAALSIACGVFLMSFLTYDGPAADTNLVYLVYFALLSLLFIWGVVAVLAFFRFVARASRGGSDGPDSDTFVKPS